MSNPVYNLDVSSNARIPYITASNVLASNIVYSAEPSMQVTPILTTSNNVYTTIYKWIYNQSNRNMTSVNVSSYMSPNCNQELTNSNFTYSVRVMDVTANLLLGSNTFSNNNPYINVIQTTNTARSPYHLLEVQVKKGSLGQNVACETMCINYT